MFGHGSLLISEFLDIVRVGRSAATNAAQTDRPSLQLQLPLLGGDQGRDSSQIDRPDLASAGEGRGLSVASPRLLRSGGCAGS
jgi:hypothetical protein